MRRDNASEKQDGAYLSIISDWSVNVMMTWILLNMDMIWQKNI
jgi:hypothetical protein